MNEEEKTFLNTEAAKVTSARVVIGNQTFAMAGITSVEVKHEEDRPALWPGFVGILLGLLMTAASVVAGLLLIGGAVYGLVRAGNVKSTYHLVIRAAGGEINALTSADSAVVETIAAAITDAMVYRG